jgi:C-terminal four TMM region of protein-O-mannosyltransferase/Dolichyl-phosphate-mannose-protein mannosyltransferase
VTGPASRAERGTGAPSRLTGTQGAVGAVLVVLALGLALRLIIAYLLPGSGFKVDLGAFQFWASNLASQGPHGFYDRDFFHDYTPGYLYVLWLVGIVGQAIGGIGDLIKLPPILADLAIGWLAWSMVRELGGRDRLALAAAAVAVLNPISWFDSVVWGQADSFGVVFVLLGLRELWRDRPERAAIYTVIAALIKPQLGILIPLVAVVTIRRALWPAGGEGDAARTGHPVRILTTGLAGLATAVLLCIPFGLSVIEFSSQPPYLSSGLLGQVAVAAGGYPYLTVNAYNPWALVPSDLGQSLANAGLWVCDYAGLPADCGAGTAVFGPIPAVAIGTMLLLASIAVVLWFVARRPDRLTLLVGLAVLSLAFFVVPTRVHERYGFPFFALGVILAAISWRWRLAYIVLSIATFANMYVVLTTLYPDNPSIADWLGMGPAIRSEIGVTILSVLHGLAFLWAFVQLRSSARERLEAELEEASLVEDDESVAAQPPRAGLVPAGSVGSVAMSRAMPTAVPAAALATSGSRRPPAASPIPARQAVALPTWTPRATFEELGIVGWFRARLNEPPIRPDRSATLRSEGGGRLDKLDLWLVVVLILGTMLLRTFRLAEPLQMHFDEVYHARTATEFLQDWRYGLSHDIYEWTHPHLAKYIMAGGLVLWGGDGVKSTSELEVPVRDAIVEPRRDDPLAPGGRAGDRLHVATGSEVRTYDLRSRALVSVVAAPGASTLAVDDGRKQLVIGYDDGRLATLDLAALGAGGVDLGLEPTVIATLDHPIQHLYVADDGTTVVAASSDRLTIVDVDTGTATGSMALPGIADVASGGSGTALVANVDQVADPAALASTLADLLNTDAVEYQRRLATASPGTTVVLGDPGTGDARKALDAAIADESVTGVKVESVTRVAVATSDGVAFIDQERASLLTTIVLDGGAHGLGVVTGIDDPRLYATSGPSSAPTYTVMTIGGEAARGGPLNAGSHPLPAPGTRIAYDAASQQVHILGLTQDAVDKSTVGEDTGPWTVYVVEPHSEHTGPWTVYVIEPHGNAVYADARLPAGFVPSAWASDFAPDYPSEDRQQLLVFDGEGSSAAIDAGSHAFAWRFPGVIAGALTAALLYLLTRILFRRRLVAGLVGLFVIADGMFFVQSRIGMNDVYVGLFIIAAYTVFAALWTGWWRGRAAFWLGMPVIGVLLGLALASKWVAAYAIGALVLLILVRSALGRVLAILGLIGITAVLGYLAISLPVKEGVADPGLGNLTFLLIMIALTLLAVVVAVVHPIAWTDEELRFAIGAPTVLGALVFFGALATGRLDASVVVGSVAVTPLLVAIALGLGSLVVAGLFMLAGRWGFGPLAVAPAPDDPIRLLEPPGQPAEGWLRPGSLLGLPIVWMAICLLAVPLGVYVLTYLPWAMIEGHQIVSGWPPGHTGQTLLDLTGQMYAYHNGLTAPHPASSPWWAWPMNLKPVWFYQEGLAGGTTAALYDAGSLVIWWMGIPAIAFVSWMAFKRRSLALTLIAIGFAAQWIPWARIDRAAFQYHYYTALPFVVMALAYFIAELWHGASRHTWQLARVAGAVAVVMPALLWLLDRPLCAFVGVDSVNPNSAACPAVIPEFVLTARTAGLAIVIGVGLLVIVYRFLAFEPQDGHEAGRGQLTAAFRSLVATGVVVAVALAVVSLLPETAILTLTNVPVEPIALIAGIPLGYLALQILGSRDARRFVVGFGVAAVGWFAILYPNISALPLPSSVAPMYQGILPTYLYAFQFPVSTVDRNTTTPLLTPMFAILLAALTVTCVIVAYSAWVWRLALADAAAAAAGPGSGASDDTDGLARSGGA